MDISWHQIHDSAGTEPGLASGPGHRLASLPVLLHHRPLAAALAHALDTALPSVVQKGLVCPFPSLFNGPYIQVCNSARLP